MELFIPTKIDKNSKYGKGIGSKEFRNVVLSGLISLPLFAILFSIIFRGNLQVILIATAFMTAVVVSISALFFKKTIAGRSLYDVIRHMIRFFKEQQYYKYKKIKEWY